MTVYDSFAVLVLFEHLIFLKFVDVVKVFKFVQLFTPIFSVSKGIIRFENTLYLTYLSTYVDNRHSF